MKYELRSPDHHTSYGVVDISEDESDASIIEKAKTLNKRLRLPYDRYKVDGGGDVIEIFRIEASGKVSYARQEHAVSMGTLGQATEYSPMRSLAAVFWRLG